MEVRIGIKQSPRELTFETSADADTVRALFTDATAESLIALSDTKGNEYLVSAESVAYVELASSGGRKVGFVS